MRKLAVLFLVGDKIQLSHWPPRIIPGVTMVRKLCSSVLWPVACFLVGHLESLVLDFPIRTGGLHLDSALYTSGDGPHLERRKSLPYLAHG